MKTILLSLALVSWVFVSHAEEEDEWMMLRSSDNGVSYVYSAAESVVVKTPDWSPGKTDAPLSVSQVATKALEWVRKQPGKFDEIKIDTIEASRFHLGTIKAKDGTSPSDKWYYIVEYYLISKGEMTSSTPRRIAILMDGTIVPPKIVKN